MFPSLNFDYISITCWLLLLQLLHCVSFHCQRYYSFMNSGGRIEITRCVCVKNFQLAKMNIVSYLTAYLVQWHILLNHLNVPSCTRGINFSYVFVSKCSYSDLDTSLNWFNYWDTMNELVCEQVSEGVSVHIH